MVRAEHERPSQTYVVTFGPHADATRSCAVISGRHLHRWLQRAWRLGDNGGNSITSGIFWEHRPYPRPCPVHSLSLSCREVGSSYAICTMVLHRLKTVGSRPWTETAPRINLLPPKRLPSAFSPLIHFEPCVFFFLQSGFFWLKALTFPVNCLCNSVQNKLAVFLWAIFFILA